MVEVKRKRSRRIRPVSWSTSYLLRLPLGISTSTSNSNTVVCLPIAAGPGADPSGTVSRTTATWGEPGSGEGWASVAGRARGRVLSLLAVLLVAGVVAE